MSTGKLIRGLALSESGFVFLPTTGETFTVNEQGRAVILGLQDGKTTDQIIASLAEDYDAEPNNIRRDFDDFMLQLRNYQLLIGDQ